MRGNRVGGPRGWINTGKKIDSGPGVPVPAPQGKGGKKARTPEVPLLKNGDRGGVPEDPKTGEGGGV